MCNSIKVCLYIGKFNAGIPNYHHCLLSSDLSPVLKGREECSVMSLHMPRYWIILISTLIPTLNVPIYKFKYQSMITMQIINHYADYCLLDHFADQQLFDHCADHHLPDHDANIIQLSNSYLHA